MLSLYNDNNRLNDEPPLSKQWIHQYRLRPSSTNELCSRGCKCLFNTFSNDPNVCYIGRVFETEREHFERESNVYIPTGRYIRNIDRLCYDCIIYEWTERAFKNASESIDSKQFNYFTVSCGYNTQFMLPCILNGKKTGILGYIPMYSKVTRSPKVIKLTEIDNGQYITFSTNYIADFSF